MPFEVKWNHSYDYYIITINQMLVAYQTYHLLSAYDMSGTELTALHVIILFNLYCGPE